MVAAGHRVGRPSRPVMRKKAKSRRATRSKRSAPAPAPSESEVDRLREWVKHSDDDRNYWEKLGPGDAGPGALTAPQIAVALVLWPAMDRLRWSGCDSGSAAHERLGTALSEAVTSLLLERRVNALADRVKEVEEGKRKMKLFEPGWQKDVAAVLCPKSWACDAGCYGKCQDAYCSGKCDLCRSATGWVAAIATVRAKRRHLIDMAYALAAILPSHEIAATQGRVIVQRLENVNAAAPVMRIIQERRSTANAQRAVAQRLQAFADQLEDVDIAAAVREAGSDPELLRSRLSTKVANDLAAIERGARVRSDFAIRRTGPLPDPWRRMAFAILADVWEDQKGTTANANNSATRGDRRTDFVVFVEAVFERFGRIDQFDEQAIQAALRYRKNRQKP
jgi:hypothetical protein